MPDAKLLFGGDYAQHGLDLVLSKDGREFTIHDYFRDSRHADLRSPDGAVLTANLVDALTAGHTQYAQAGPAADAGKVIGQVTKLTGSATAIRNGVSVELHQGDNVLKGDVVQAGGDSSCTMTFVDGTVFGLSSNARMVLNEMIYDPNGSSNSSLMSLVQGTITFVAGETAKHGDMKVDTPVATMGIRGTAVLVELGFDVQYANGQSIKVSMIVEPGNVVGSLVMYDKTTGAQIGSPVNQQGLSYFVNLAGNMSTAPATPLPPEAKAIVDNVMLQYFGNAYNPQQNDANPKSDNNTHDSAPQSPPPPPPPPSGDSHSGDNSGSSSPITKITLTVTNPDTGKSESFDVPIKTPPTVHVTNVVDTTSFNIADEVTITNTNGDTNTPYVAGSAAFDSATDTSPYAAGINLSTLIHIDPASGHITYDPNDFEFLSAGEKAVYTIDFKSNAGPFTPGEQITLTIDGVNVTPTISGTNQASVTERVNVTGAATADVASGALNVTDPNLSDTHTVTSKLLTAVWSNGSIVPSKTLTDLATALQSQIQNDNHTGQETLAWNFSLTDHDLDFLAKGEKLTVQYQLIVTDSSGADNASSTPEILTLTLFANNDQPTLLVETTPVVQPPTDVFTLPLGNTVTGQFNSAGFDVAGNPDATFTTIWSDTEPSGATLVSRVHLQDVSTTGTTVGSTKTLSFTTSLLQFVDNGAGKLGVLYFDQTSSALRFQLFDENGNALSTAKAVFTNPFGAGSTHVGSFPAGGIDITHNPDGSFNALWLFDDTSGGVTTVHAHTATISADGSTVGTIGDLALGNNVTALQADTNSLGQTVVAFLDGTDLKIEVLDSGGNLIAAPATIFSNTSGGSYPTGGLDVLHRNDGSFAVAWSFTDANGGAHTYVEQISATGVQVSSVIDLPIGGPFQLSLDSAGDVGVVHPDAQGHLVFSQVTFTPLTYDAAELDNAAHSITDVSTPDTVTGFIPLTDADLNDTHTVSSTLVSSVWSGGSTFPAATLADVSQAFHPSVVGEDKSGFAAIAWTFSTADRDFDFLAAGETLTLQYKVIVTDNSGTPNASSVPEIITITMTGTNDAPVLSADVSGLNDTAEHDIVEQVTDPGGQPVSSTDQVQGTLGFTDVDLNDTHLPSQSGPAFAWADSNGNALTLSTDQIDALTAASNLALAESDSTHIGAGSIGITYTAADNSFAFLAAGETLTITYQVTVTDNNGAQSTQPVTITVHGTNDTPTITSSTQSGSVTEDADLSPQENIETHHQSGAVTFADVDLNDVEKSSIVATVVTPTLANGYQLTQAQHDALVNAFTIDAATHSNVDGSGSIGWQYDIADSALDFLGAKDQVVLTYTVQVDDHNGGTAQQVVTITVHGSEDAPVISPSTQSASITEDLTPPAETSSEAASGTIAFSDVDLSDKPASSIVVADTTVTSTLANGYQLTQAQHDALVNAFTIDPASFSSADGTGSIGWHYNITDGALDFLGKNDQVVLTYTVQVDDGNGGTAQQNVQITVNGSEDAPFITSDAAAATASFDEAPGTGNTFQDVKTGTITFADVDLSDAHQVDQTIVPAGIAPNNNPVFTWSGGSLTADQLASLEQNTSFSLVPHETVGSGVGSVDWTFRIFDNALDFLGANQTLTVTYNVTISDGNGGQANQLVTVIATGTNDAPTVTAGVGTVLNYTESQAPTAIAPALTVADVDSPTFASATVQITGNLHASEDVLGFFNGDAALYGNITSTYDAAHGLLTLTSAGATASVAQWQNALEAVTYFNSSDNPSADARTISYQVNDGAALDNFSNVATATVNVTPVDNVPTIAFNQASVTTQEDTSVTISGLSVTDVDAGAAQIEVTLSAAHGTLTLGSINGLDPATNGNGTGTVTLLGSQAAIDAALATGVTYSPAADYNGADNLHMVVNDQGANGTGGPKTATLDVPINVTAVNDAPTAIAPATDYQETAGTPISLTSNALQVGDVDGNGGIETVTLSVGEGVLNVSTGANAVTVASGNGTSTVTFSGTVADLDALLAGNNNGAIIYNDTAADPSSSTTLTLTIDDNGNTGSGGPASATATAAIDIAPSGPPSPPSIGLGATLSHAFTTLDATGLTGSGAVGINDSDVVVGQGDLDSQHQRAWSYDGTTYTTLQAFGAQDTSAHAINSLGEIVGDYSPVRSTPRYGFTDINGTFTQVVSDSSGQSTNANGVNDAGVIVGSDYLHVGTRYAGYIDDHGTFTYLSAPGATNGSGDTYANGINSVGQVVGSFNPNANNSSGYQGYLYSNGSYTTISDPLGVKGTFAEGINDFGQIVGFYADAAGTRHGFVDSGGVFTTIDDPLGVNGTVIQGINNLGQVVGYYLDANKVMHGFETSLSEVATLQNKPVALTTLSVSDPSAGGNPITVTLGVSHGTLSLASTTGLTAGGLGTGVVTLTGTVAVIDAALASGLTFTPSTDYLGADTLSIVANDGTQSVAQNVQIAVGQVAGVNAIENGGANLNITAPTSFSGLLAGGDGLIAEQSATGTGSITVTTTHQLTGTGAGSVGLLAENLNTANTHDINVTATGGASGVQYGIQVVDDSTGGGNITVEAAGAITSTALQGIRAQSFGTGNTTITTDAGTTIHSAGSGINVVNQATAIAPGLSMLTVTTASGTITSGAVNNISGSLPDGIVAGYYGTNATANTAINGTVIINNGANIDASAAGYGIDGYNYGSGDVTVNDGAGTTVTGAQYGIGAFGLSGGTGNVAVNVGQNATITGTATYGIEAWNLDAGNVSVTMSTGDVIHSGQQGIFARGAGPTVPAGDKIQVIAHGSITSGALSGINAGYYPGTNTVEPNVAGDVIVQSDATIHANGGIGIQAYNWGTGSVSVTAGAGSSITSDGIGINAGSSGASVPAGESVNVTAHGTINSGQSGINAYYNAGGLSQPNSTVAGDIVVQSDATIVATTGTGIGAFNWGTGNVSITTGAASSITALANNTAAINGQALDGGNVSITAAGTLSGAQGISAIENGAGTIFIENDAQVSATTFVGIGVTQNATAPSASTTITNTGSVVGPAGHVAIGVLENGGGTVTINNTGTIGSSPVSSTSQAIGGTGTFVINNNNHGVIDGSVTTGNAGAFTGTFNNNAGATWLTPFVDDEGTITASGANSVITMAGTQAVFNVGNTATGALTLQQGAALTGSLTIANFAGSHGTVTVTGAGTSLDTTTAQSQFQNILVGADGTASMTIADQAIVTTKNMTVALNHDAGVTDTLDVNNATLNVTNLLSIGVAGVANATVENGGLVNAATLFVGNGSAGGVGNLTVSGDGSVVNVTSFLGLGSAQSSGTVTVNDGGAIDVGVGTTSIANAIHVGNNASLQGAGTINADVVNDDYIAASVGALHITGAVSGTGNFGIGVGEQLELGSTVAATDTFSFQGTTGTLKLDDAKDFAGLIQNFAGTDGIDLTGFDPNTTTVTPANDGNGNTVLTITDATHTGASAVRIALQGDYTGDTFGATTDNSNGAVVAITGTVPTASADSAVTIAPDNVLAPVFRDLVLSDASGMIDHAIVTWSTPSVGAIGGLPGTNNSGGITTQLLFNADNQIIGYAYTGLASIADYVATLSNLGFSNTTNESVDTFTLRINDGIQDSTPITVNVNVAPTSDWFVWNPNVNGDGTTWADDNNWTHNGAPGAPQDDTSSTQNVFINADGKVSLDTSFTTYTLGDINIRAGTELDVSGNDPSSDAVTINGSFINYGDIIVTNAAFNVLTDSNGLAFVGGELIADQRGVVTIGGALVPLTMYTLDTTSTIRAQGGGTVLIDHATINGGTLQSVDQGSIVQFDAATLNHLTLTSVPGGNSSPSPFGFEVQADSTGNGAPTTFDGTPAQAFVIDGSATVNVDDGATLQLVGTIQGDGNIIVDQGQGQLDGGTLQVEGIATLDGITVTDNGTVQIDLAQGPTSILTLEDGASIDGGQLNIGGVGELNVAAGPQGPVGGGNPDATLDGVTVANSGTISVEPAASGLILQLDDATTITGGNLVIGSGSALDVEVGPNGNGGSNGSNFDAMLDGVTVINGGTINVDLQDNGGAILTLADGTTISGSNLDINNGGGVYVQNGSNSSFGATLDNVTVTTNGNEIEIGAPITTGSILNLEDGTVISGGTLSLDDAADVVNVAFGTNATGATLDGVTVNNNGTVQVDPTGQGATLTLDDYTAFNNGNLSIGSQGTVALSSASINGTAIAFVGSGGTLSLDAASTISGPISGFGDGDTLDFTDITWSATVTDVWNDTTSTLTVSDGTHTATLNLVGQYDQNSFALKQDAGAGVDVVSSPAEAVFSATDGNGDVAEGLPLSVTLLDFNPTFDPNSVTYQWLSDGQAISGQTGKSYTPTATDLGKTLDVVVRFTDGGVEQVTADAPAVVAPPVVSDSADAGGVTTHQNTALTLTGLNVTFADAGTDTLEATLSVGHGTLSFVNAAGLTVISDGTSGSPLDVTGSLSDINAALANGVVYSPTTGYTGLDTLSVHANDGSFGSNTDNININVASNSFAINEAPQTPSVADESTWYATGKFTVSDPVSGDSLTWTIVGGSRESSASYQYGIHQFAVTKVVNGTPTTVFNDTFNGTVPPAGPAILLGSSPSGTSYSDFSSGTYAQGNGEALLEGSNAGYVGSASGLGSTYGDPVFGQFTTLLTGTSFNAPAGDGLRSGQSFTTSGLFDLATPPNSNSRYGIRLSDRATNSGAADQPGTETVDFGVFQNGNGNASVVLSELNFETGISTVLQAATINLAHADDNEILLSLSNNAANNGQVVASYTLEHVVNGVEVADGGPITLGAVGRIFDNEDWTRAQFYGFSVATTTSASPQADSILQGTYGQLDLQQDGTWHYVLNPGLASTKALAAGQVAQDNFQVQVNGTGGQATQTISVNVTGINDPPVATTPTAHYHATPGAALSLVNTGLSVSDPDGGNSLETATLSVGEGIITITAGDSGVSIVNGNGTGSVSFSGTIAQINALLTNSTGTVSYIDNAASPSSSTALTLTIDDNGSNGGSALSDSASATIDLSSASFGSSDWRHDINVFGATQGTATRWIVANRDGSTSTVFNGGGITYDPSTHLPTNGGISSISLVDNASQTVLQTITGVAISAGDFGSLVARLESIQDKIPWASLVNLDSNGPLSVSATDIHFANNDGTFTDVIGTGFAQSGDQLSGTVTSVELLDAQGHVLQTAGFGLSTSLSDVAAALFPDEASKQFYNLALRGNTSLTGFSPSGNSTNFNFTLDDAPGNHTITGPAQSFYTVDFADATSGVTVNLGTGTASWGGHLDTLVHIANVAGSKFADTITGDANINFLDGQGAQGGGQDTLTGGGGSDTFVFQKGYGALTITDFDQGNGGSFNQSEGDLIQLSNLSANPTVGVNADNDTVLNFGGGDVITLQNVTQAEFNALGGAEFIGGGNNGSNGNSGGPVITGADNTVAFAGVPVALDPAIAVTDTTGTVSSVNVWISSGAQSGDTLSINGVSDGTITINGVGDGTINDNDGSQIHYHFDATNADGPSFFLSAILGTPTLTDFDAALQSIEFSPGAADGNRTVTWAAYDNVVHSPTVTTTVEVGPVLNGFGLTVTEGSTTVLSNSNFAVSDPGYSDLTYTVNNVIGGHFEVYNGTNWVSAPTGGFTTSQIAAEEVRFVQDGSATVPDLSIHVSDPNNASADIAAKMSLEITGVNSQENSQTITFGGPSGTLQLDNPSSFTGEIAGIAGSGNVLDLLHFLNATTTAVTGNGSYDSTSNTTTLTVTDSSNGGQTETFKLVGDYSHSTWTVSDDHHGGSNIVDPPAPVGQTIVATAQNQTLTGSASGDNFVFNSANIGHDTVTDFQPGNDLLQFANQVFATAQAALDATQDDGHGNTVVALDSHDNITLSGVVKAQLHLNDFHIA